ncbi:MAG: DUF3108 domain-containing protein [Magnetococcales bacterium]|nr:DUF3108 domain-containing protein [Magnetococcales bacterium]
MATRTPTLFRVAPATRRALSERLTRLTTLAPVVVVALLLHVPTIPLRSASAATETTTTAPGAVNGERLEFNIHWQGVPAGRATLTYATLDDPASKSTRYALVANLLSIGPVDWIYGVNDTLTVRGVRSDKGFASEHYLKVQRQGQRQRRAEYTFLREKNQATLQKNDDPLKTFDEIGATTNDPITAFYHLRASPTLKPAADKIALSVLDGDRWYAAEVTVGPAEKLFTSLGWFQAFPLHPLLQSSELFRQQGDLTVWVTDDARHLPLRVETKVRIGSVAAELIAFDDGRGESRHLHDAATPAAASSTVPSASAAPAPPALPPADARP